MARDFPRIFALAVAFYYAGNAIGAPLWGLLGTRGLYHLGMYAAPVLLALFVLGVAWAVKRGKAGYTEQVATEADEASHDPVT